MGPNELVMQLLMAPFPQMLLTSIATLAISYILLKLTKIKDPRIRGFFYSLTLIAPIIVYLVNTPTLWMTRPVFKQNPIGDSSIVISQASNLAGQAVTGFAVASPVFTTVTRAQEIAGVNYTGLLCIIGLAFGAMTLAISYLFGVKIVKKCQGVIDVSAEDEPRIYKSVEKLAQKMGVPVPKIGLTESLQPNAFTIGYGVNAMVVFSSGLITTLNHVEFEAVIAHELAHIKNRDFHLMAIASSLKIVSFFNPASYLSASMFAREREYLADDVGSKATGKRNTLKRALVKIAATPSPQRSAVLPELVSGLFIYSQIGSLKAAFTSHPSLDMRLDRIGHGGSRGRGDVFKAALVAFALIGSMALLSSYILQPMWMYEAFFGFGPSVRVHMGSTMTFNGPWSREYNVYSIQIRPFAEAVARELHGKTALRQLVVL